MFIGHLPSSYLVFKVVASKRLSDTAFKAGMLGAVIPDIDMLWFYFVDNRDHHHHEYLTHRPAIWLGLLLLCLALSRWSRVRHAGAAIAFCLGAMTHMVFDSVTGHIAWFWPFSEAFYPLVVVQPTHSHWILSFLAHWTFKVEIAAIVIAGFVFWRARRASGPR